MGLEVHENRWGFYYFDLDILLFGMFFCKWMVIEFVMDGV